MTEPVWIARTRAGDELTTWRARTGGEAPGPDTLFTAIADPFELARGRRAPCDPATLAAQAEALGEPRTLAELARGARGETHHDPEHASDYRSLCRSTLQYLVPPCSPQKVFGIGRNFRAHAEELGNEVPQTPLSFLKAPSCLLVSGDPLALPRGYERIDMEAELVVVIGRRARAVAAAQAWDHVAGYLLGNDVSCRDLQRRDRQWTRAKGLDGFGPVSAFIRLVEPGWQLPVGALELHGYLDDLRVQSGRLSAMIFSIPALIEHLSAGMTLEPGDLIFTGTPAGVSALSPGQVARVELAGLELGRLVTPIT